MLGNYRDALGEAFVRVGEEYPNLVVVTADVSKSTRSVKFKERFPDRFFSVGIAEANAVGIAAGIATFGIPVIFTAYAMFAVEKPFEQVRNMVVYPRLNVKIVATHGGINVGEDGVTHQAIEDIALMRSLPGMTVVVAADPGEVTAALRAVLSFEGPAYLRLARAPAEVLHPDGDGTAFEIGKAELLRDGRDVTLMGVGMLVRACLVAADRLQEDGISARVLNVRTVKPLDEAAVLDAAAETGAVVTAEDHNRFGGLGGAVAEVLSSHRPVPLEMVAIDDTFGRSGDGMLLMRRYGLTSDRVYERAIRAIERKRA